MGSIISQAGGSGATGDLTLALGNTQLAILCGEATGGTISSSVVTWVIQNAEAEAWSLLGPGFTVPFATAATERIVKGATTDIAVQWLYKRKPDFRTQTGDTPVQKQYDAAVKVLQDIRSGERSMDDDSQSALSGGVVYSTITNFITDDNEGSSSPSGGF